MKQYGLMLCALLLCSTGCATIFEGRHQNFTVNTTNDASPQATYCLLKNMKGEWKTAANTQAIVHRDSKPMSIECENESQIAKASLRPRFQGGYIALDILWDYCILTFSCIIDGSTKAFFEYPAVISLEMKSKQDPNAGLQEALIVKRVPDPAPKQQEETVSTQYP